MPSFPILNGLAKLEDVLGNLNPSIKTTPARPI